jgi:hypothetical protein
MSSWPACPPAAVRWPHSLRDTLLHITEHAAALT